VDLLRLDVDFVTVCVGKTEKEREMIGMSEIRSVIHFYCAFCVQ
jgi:hypothetical protein